MGAALAIQTALVASLQQVPGLSGVYHDAPARADFPYLVVGSSSETDWSCKRRAGREITVQVTCWDEQPARLLALEDMVDAALSDLASGPDWHLSSIVLASKRRTRNPAGPWSSVLDYRARLIKVGDGGTA